MEEIWKNIYFIENDIIYDYRGLYQISNLGRVKSLGNHSGHNSKERIKKGHKANKGYIRVELSNKDFKRRSFAVHRLVAFMFLKETYFDGAEVNHKDENKENNNVDNLEWCTAKYNCSYGTRNERRSKKIKGDKHYASRKVIQYDKDMNLIKIWNCISDIERELGIFQSNITKCCLGERKSTGGFKWKYFEKENENELL